MGASLNPEVFNFIKHIYDIIFSNSIVYLFILNSIYFSRFNKGVSAAVINIKAGFEGLGGNQCLQPMAAERAE